WWLDVRPIGVRRALPCCPQSAQPGVAIALLKPDTELVRGVRTIAIRRRDVALIPDVVAAQPRMRSVTKHQVAQELGCALADTFAVQAETGESSDNATRAHLAVGEGPIARLEPCVGKLTPHPLGRGGDHLGDDGLESMLRREIELTIVVAPV